MARAKRQFMQPISQPSGLFAIWGYVTDDPITSLVEEDYFQPCAGLLRRGDIIQVLRFEDASNRDAGRIDYTQLVVSKADGLFQAGGIEVRDLYLLERRCDERATLSCLALPTPPKETVDG